MRWRRRAVLPTYQLPSARVEGQAHDLTLGNRRRRAAERAWALMPTSIPTRDILDSYLTDVLSAP